MKVRLIHLALRTRQTTEHLQFSDTVTFLYGPVGTGKSTVARLVDYCFGGELERTPAIQQEFIAVALGARLGEYDCILERGAEDTQAVRVTWARGETAIGSLNAPLTPSDTPLMDAEIFNLSDLLFHLCGAEPIRVPQRARDPESPMIRLSFRDIWRYCYLDQTHLDSSFFRLEDPFRGRKSQDAMRFFTGLHSERLSQLQADLYRTITDQQGSREAVAQIRSFMARFDLGSELEIASQINATEIELREAEQRKEVLESARQASLHPTDALRQRLRELSRTVSDLQEAVNAAGGALEEQKALRAELITAKIRADRSEQAGRVLEGVEYERCPQCGSNVSERAGTTDTCRLCGSPSAHGDPRPSIELEAIHRELNDRIDQLGDSITRRTLALDRTKRQLHRASTRKGELDQQLQQELARYDSAYIESVRLVDREIGTLQERRRSLVRLSEMPRAISELEEQAGALQGRIDRLRTSVDEERQRLRSADENARAIAQNFKAIMLEVRFPGVSVNDEVVLDPRNWTPTVVHRGQEWGFWDTGSGGKKTLFNVCYALALHVAAHDRGMPVPDVLIVDSPTKNISDDENPELVRSLYRKIYRVAAERNTQFLLIDSELVEPRGEVDGFSCRRLAGELGAPSLISYYVGP
jgi:hypothetical protein